MAPSSIYGLCVAVNLLWFFAVEVSGAGIVYQSVNDPMSIDEASVCTIVEVFSYGLHEEATQTYVPDDSYQVIRYSCAATKRICPSSDYPHYFELVYLGKLFYVMCGKKEETVQSFAFRCKIGNKHIFDLHMVEEERPKHITLPDGRCHTCVFIVEEGKIPLFNKDCSRKCKATDGILAKRNCVTSAGSVKVRRNAQWMGMHYGAVEMDEE